MALTKEQEEILSDLVLVAQKHDIILHACSCCEGFAAEKAHTEKEDFVLKFMSVGPLGASARGGNIGLSPWG